MTSVGLLVPSRLDYNTDFFITMEGMGFIRQQVNSQIDALEVEKIIHHKDLSDFDNCQIQLA